MAQVEYTEKIILFIDILGFKNLINQKKPEEIREILNLIYKFLKRENKSLPNYQISHFSDSVILSFELPKDGNIVFILSILQTLIISLLQQYSVLLRGGMCKGNIYHTNELVFGPGVNHAYEIESKTAIYPRIVVDQCIVNCFNNWNKQANPKQGETKSENFFELDCDGYYIFKYLNCKSNQIYQNDWKTLFEKKLQTTKDIKVAQKLQYVIKKLS